MNKKNNVLPVNRIAETSDAMKILDGRFTKGEIEEEEYARKKEMLKKP